MWQFDNRTVPRHPDGAARARRPRRCWSATSDYMSPSYTRVYPLVVERGSGAVIEDVDGNLFLDFTAGIAVTATGHCHPQVVAAIQDQAGKLMHMSGTDFYYQPQIDLAQRLAEAGARPVAQARLLHQQRRRGAGSGPEAGPLAHRPVAGHRLLRRLPWPHLRGHVAVRLEAGPSPRLLAAGAGHPSRPLSARLPRTAPTPTPAAPACEQIEETLLQAHRAAGEVAAIFVEPIQGEGGYHVPPAACRPCGSCATGTASCWSPTRCRPAWAAPARCSDFTVICSQSSCVNGYRNTDTTFDVIGGTSIGTPQFAGILALTNQALMNAGKATLGNPDAALYQIASNTYPLVTPTSWAFNDITTGDNIVACAAPTTANPDTGCPANGGSMGYSAGVGYDQVTGLGSVDASALIDAINGTPNAHFLVLPVSRYETIVPSGNAVVALTVTPKEGFTGTVALMCATASLTVATCSFDNPSVAAGGSANLTIQAGSSQSSQSGTVTVTGTSGSTTNSVVVNVAINAPDFSITSGKSTETVSSGGSTNDTITVTPIQGFTSSVTLSCTQVTGTGLSCSTSPTAVTPGTPSTLTVSATSSATSGSVILTATGGGRDPLADNSGDGERCRAQLHDDGGQPRGRDPERGRE